MVVRVLLITFLYNFFFSVSVIYIITHTHTCVCARACACVCVCVCVCSDVKCVSYLTVKTFRQVYWPDHCMEWVLALLLSQ